MNNKVLVIGAFDLLHAGHARFLAEARSFGDKLVVGVASDDSRERQKGPGHPLVDEKNRAALLKFIKPVGEVRIVDEEDILDLIISVKPSVFYTLRGNSFKKEEIDSIRKFGGRVARVEKQLPYLSSSEMVDRVADLKIKQVVEYFIGKVENKTYSGKRSEAQFFNPKIHESVLAVGSANVPSNLLGLMYFGNIVPASDLAVLGKKLRKEGNTIVFTAIGGDLLHVGHAKYLKKAADLGDYLVVGIPSNKSMRRQKGKGRPVIDEISRAELLCYLNGVSSVVIFDEDTVLETIQSLKPDIFQTVDDVWNKNYKKSLEYKAVVAYGGKVVLCSKQAEGVSATQLINKAAKVRLERMFKDCLR